MRRFWQEGVSDHPRAAFARVHNVVVAFDDRKRVLAVALHLGGKLLVAR